MGSLGALTFYHRSIYRYNIRHGEEGGKACTYFCQESRSFPLKFMARKLQSKPVPNNTLGHSHISLLNLEVGELAKTT